MRLREVLLDPAFSSPWIENLMTDLPGPRRAFSFLPTSVSCWRSVVVPTQSSSLSSFLLTQTSAPEHQCQARE